MRSSSHLQCLVICLVFLCLLKNVMSVTRVPTRQPSRSPTTVSPTTTPSRTPTAPSRQPTFTPSNVPTFIPSRFPTFFPTLSPSRNPTLQPTGSPTLSPSRSPTFIPSKVPTSAPTTSMKYWVSSVVSLSHSSDDETGQLTVVASSNREIYRELGGHFRIIINATILDIGNFNGTSECIEIGAAASTVIPLLQSIPIHFANTSQSDTALLSDYLNVSVKRFGDGKIESNYQTKYLIQFSGNELWYLRTDVSVIGCAPLETIASWNDASNWRNGKIPASVHDVVIPADAGYIKLTTDIEIASIDMQGGKILADNSPCPPGWSLGSPNLRLGKCYKLFEEPLTYLASDKVCRGMGKAFGTLGTSLVQIENYTELETVQGLCRGNSDSLAYKTGCWIGLQDAFGTGYFNWRDPSSMSDISFRNWRRRSDRSDRLKLNQPGAFINNGDNCVHLVPWQNDPLYQEEGALREVSCIDDPKAFVCQMSVAPRRYSVTINEMSSFSGGSIIGGYLHLKNSFNITSFTADSAAVITASQSDRMAILVDLSLLDGSKFILGTNAKTVSRSRIGEVDDLMRGRQPIFQILDGYQLNCVSSGVPYDVMINAKVIIGTGSIQVRRLINLHLRGGGEISLSDIFIDQSATLTIDGYAMRMMTYDAFDLTLSHRGEVIGEYYSSYLLEKEEEENSRVVPQTKGVYRLAVSETATPSTLQITDCIPYNASANTLADILDRLSLVADRGGSTVRLMTEGDSRFNFGYNYRIELDAPDIEYFPSGGNSGGLTFQLYCIGIHDCGCAQTKVSYRDQFGQFACPLSGNSSKIDSAACAIPPTIKLDRISSVGYTNFTGKGKMVITSGAHRLPAISTIDIHMIGTGQGTTGADIITWRNIKLDGTGKAIFTGKGWEGWDSSVLIFASFDTRGRGEDKLNDAPSFTLKMIDVTIGGGSSFLTAGPGSTLQWTNLTWNGGIIGGRSTAHISDYIIASGTWKSLRYACTLHLLETSLFRWISGNISMHNGAQFIIESDMYIEVFGDKQYFGYAELMSMPANAPYQYLLDSEPDLNSNFYFDDQVPKYLRDGSYINPLCGPDCLTPVAITFINSGHMIALASTNSTFVAPISFEDQSKLDVQTGAKFTAQSGGGCGNEVFIEISDSAVIELSGGKFFMGSTCTITGTGELLGTAGTHDLSFSINAHITIEGGVMRWPESRGSGNTLKFYGGLIISGDGQLLVEPSSTTIIVDKVVHFKDNCLLQFPMISTTGQPSVYDTLDAPDLSPRGVFTATNVMRWEGGTLRGKADFISNQNLYLFGGTKHIRSLAKLINKGHAIWSDGDIVMADQADFVNLGYVETGNGTMTFDGNNLVEGTVIPVENGGDPFALQYHSWDLDQGSLSFTEYLRLRTLYVSRAPIGWTEELDGRV